MNFMSRAVTCIFLSFTFASASGEFVDEQKVYIQKLNEIKSLNKVENSIDGVITSLSKQLLVTKSESILNSPIIVTSFVQLDKLKKTAEFGRVLSESLMSELSLSGLTVMEYRGQNAISVNETGEFFITRDAQNMRQEIPNNLVLVGTYSRLVDKVLINARIIDNSTSRVISSGRIVYSPKASLDCKMFDDCMPIKIIPTK